MAYNEQYYNEKQAVLDKEYQQIKDEYVQHSMVLAAELQEKLTELRTKREALQKRMDESKANSNGGSEPTKTNGSDK